MDELRVRDRAEFLDRVSEHGFPRRVDTFEAAVEAGNAQQVDRQCKESIEFFFGPPPLHELADLTADRAQHRQ
jgi:hypothetical protein